DDFPKGYARFCRQVLQVMVPLMRDGGLGYADAATACGYDHSDQFWDKPILPRLDYYGKLMPDAVWGSNPNAPDEQRRIGKIGNPTVHIGLNQLRLLVNEIIAAFSHPAEIVIELARDL
ncbi:MAG: type II CRISPR RNA-guided endonuclease Cas9, partial [Nitrospinales bacterium]